MPQALPIKKDPPPIVFKTLAFQPLSHIFSLQIDPCAGNDVFVLIHKDNRL